MKNRLLNKNAIWSRLSDYRRMQELFGGCTDGYCCVKKQKGMHTNGGCGCIRGHMTLLDIARLEALLKAAQELADGVENYLEYNP